MIDREQFDDLKSLLEINPHELLDENVKQACGYHYWAEKSADAELAMKRAYNKYEVTKKKFKVNLRAAGGKQSNDAVEDAAGADDALNELADKAFEAEHYYNLCRSAVKALDHRLESLGRICSLNARAYYQDPKMEERGARANKRMLANLNGNDTRSEE